MDVPFDKNGNMLSYPEYYSEMSDFIPINDTLIYSGYGRGRSAIKLYWKDSNNIKYPMFISDFDDIIKQGLVNGNKITGKFTAVKKGMNYGIKLYKESD